jgi:Zn-dependent peptidase ImmA (M78 family)
MAYNRSVLSTVMLARSLSNSSLSKRLGIEKDELDRELQAEEPRQGLLRDIAHELAVPVFTFYLDEAPKFDDRIPDFRSATPTLRAKERQTLECIQRARTIQTRAEQLQHYPERELPSLLRSESVKAQASAIRKWFGVSLQSQINARDARAFYNVCRQRLERAGIFVLQDSFPEGDGSGFCLSSKTAPVIVVNSKKQNRARRLFTLIHELAHALLGETGISDPFVSHNATEKFCNNFAGEFLVPSDDIAQLLGNARVPRNPDRDDIARIARKLKISQQATALRLERMGLTASGSYSAWLAAVGGENPDYVKDRGPPLGPPPQEKVKLARYGFHFAEFFNDRLSAGSLNDFDIYRVSGLKPKYQRAYFDFVSGLSDADISTLELGDD